MFYVSNHKTVDYFYQIVGPELLEAKYHPLGYQLLQDKNKSLELNATNDGVTNEDSKHLVMLY